MLAVATIVGPFAARLATWVRMWSCSPAERHPRAQCEAEADHKPGVFYPVLMP
jgi:hypothetical protein